MGLKRNFLFNSILTVSSYISALIVFPYVSRVLGVDNIGAVNYVDNIINYFIMLSNLGISAVGIREIASNRNNCIQLSNVFFSLCKVLLHTTLIGMFIFVLVFYFVPQLQEYKPFLLIGLTKLFFSVFLIDWFYKGLEQFDYVAKRTIIIKFLYIIFVFIFVREKADYIYYFGVTTGSVVLNAFYNWIYLKNHISFHPSKIESRRFIRPLLTMGSYLILNSLYSTFNVIYLGWVCGNKEVAYYTTAFNVYLIIAAFFAAFTGVMIPRVSSMLVDCKIDEFKNAIDKSCKLTFSICLPLTIYSICESHNIINILAGTEFGGAKFPMQIINMLICINGLSQIIVLQILLPLKKDKIILWGSIMAALIAIILDFFIVEKMGALGSSIVLITSVIVANLLPWYYAFKHKYIKIESNFYIYQVLIGVPYVFICMMINIFTNNSWAGLIMAACLSLAWFALSNFIISKNMVVISLLPSIIQSKLNKHR